MKIIKLIKQQKKLQKRTKTTVNNQLDKGLG